MPAEKRLMCQRPDRDHPKFVCGYPLPCPWHTVILDVKAGTMTIPLDAGPGAARAVAIGKALRRKRRKEPHPHG